MATPYTTGSRLLELPGELRNAIYRYVLLSDDPVRVSSQSGFHEPGLLGAKKSVRADAASVYYAENTFELHIKNYNSDLLDRWTKKQITLRRENVKPQANVVRMFGPQRNWGNLRTWVEKRRMKEIDGFKVVISRALGMTEVCVLKGLFKMAIECGGLSDDGFARLLATQRNVLGCLNKQWLD